jgi:hypothetical protein
VKFPAISYDKYPVDSPGITCHTVKVRSKLMVKSEKRDCVFDPKLTPLKVLFNSINPQKNKIEGIITI